MKKFCLFSALIILFLTLLSCRYSPSIEFDLDDIAEVRIKTTHKLPRKQANKNIELSVIDKNKISDLLTVISKGEGTEEHKCADIGHIIFILNDGRKVDISYLPGHDDDFYEFRYDISIFRVDRKSFISIMEGIGMSKDWLKKTPPTIQ